MNLALSATRAAANVTKKSAAVAADLWLGFGSLGWDWRGLGEKGGETGDFHAHFVAF